MHHNRLILLLGAGMLLLTVGPARGQDAKDSPFEGYSRSAESVVENMIRSMSKLRTYSDAAVMRFDTDMGFNPPEQKLPFRFQSPGKFVIESDMHKFVSDGKELTILMKQNNRYKTEPVAEDVYKQIAGHAGGGAFMLFSAADMLLSDRPHKRFGEMFKELDVGDHVMIDGDRCVELRGRLSGPWFGGEDRRIDVVILVRESDMMLRQIDIDASEMVRKQAGAAEGAMQGTRYHMIYDVKDIRTDARFEASTFTFEAPSGAKKVEKFYSRWMPSGDSAEQIEMSGRPAADFDLETPGGDAVRLADLKGKVVALNFLFPSWGGQQDMNSQALQKIKAEYAEKGVAFLCVHPGEDGAKTEERFREAGIELPLALDPDRELFDAYFDQQFDGGIILISKDGVVQGQHRMLFNDERVGALKKDLDKLLAGETLAGGKAMSDEEREEYREQTGAVHYGGSRAEALNPERLEEAWSVRVKSPTHSYQAPGEAMGEDLWIRDGRMLRRISHDGQVSAEITLPSRGTDPYTQESYAVGQIGRRLGAVLMTTIPGDAPEGDANAGYRQPKGVLLTAVNEAGDELWKMELDVENWQMPQSLQFVDLDGRGGDELVFLFSSAIWVVDDRGEVACRKPIPGWATSLQVRDADRDKRFELYVRTNDKLIRYNYRGAGR